MEYPSFNLMSYLSSDFDYSYPRPFFITDMVLLLISHYNSKHLALDPSKGRPVRSIIVNYPWL